MKKLKRLTSVFLCTVLLSFSLAVPASAANASWTTNDSSTLSGIYKFIQYLTTAPSSYGSGSIVGLLNQILKAQIPNVSTNFALQGGYGTNALLKLINDYVQNTYNLLRGGDIPGDLGSIKQNTLASADRLLNTNSLLSGIKDSLSADNSEILNNIYELLGSEAFSYFKMSMLEYLDSFYQSVYLFKYDGFLVDTDPDLGYTPYHYLRQLAEVLANDDDKAIRDAQKENTEAAKDKFLSGSSSGSSIGSDDLGNLSDVGGTFKDITSLNGQASLSSFTDGLSSADETGQGWFSQSTKDALDAVSGSDSISTYSADSDPDPYNMSGFADNYSWLWGDAA